MGVGATSEGSAPGAAPEGIATEGSSPGRGGARWIGCIFIGDSGYSRCNLYPPGGEHAPLCDIYYVSAGAEVDNRGIGTEVLRLSSAVRHRIICTICCGAQRLFIIVMRHNYNVYVLIGNIQPHLCILNH